MTGSLTLHPLSLTAPAVIMHFSGFQGILKCLLIHISEHQNLIGLEILNDDRNQSVWTEFEITPRHRRRQNIHRTALFGKFLLEFHIRDFLIGLVSLNRCQNHALAVICMQNVIDRLSLRCLGADSESRKVFCLACICAFGNCSV